MITAPRLLAAVLTPAVLAAQQPAAPTVPLRLDWPVGSTVTVDHERTRLRETNTGQDSATSRWRLRIRVADGGRGRRLELLDLQSLDGRPADAVPAAPGAAASGAAARPLAVLEVDSAGGPRLRDAAPLVARLRETLRQNTAVLRGVNPQMDALADRYASEEFIAAAVRVAWINLAGFWIGGDLEPGEEYRLESKGMLPIVERGEYPATVHFGLTDTGRCARGRADTSCVALVMVEQPDDDSIGAIVKRMVATAGGDTAAITATDASLQRRVDLWSEPWTLLPFSLRVREGFGFEVRFGEDSTSMFRQSRDESYRFTWERVPPPLVAAATAGDERRIAALLRDGARLDGADEDGVTPLYRAASAARPGAVRRLAAAGADADVAERLALARGDLTAVRTLRAALRRATPERPDAAVALQAMRDREYGAAVEAYTELAIAEREPGPQHALLALALEKDGADSVAAAVAALVLARSACDATALRALRDAHDPDLSNWAVASLDRAAEVAARLTTCHADDGDGWHGRAWIATRRADRALEAEALRKVADLRFYSGAQLGLVRWWLEQAPPDAILVTNGDLDHMTGRQLQVEGLRPDVVLVDVDALQHLPYARALRDRHEIDLGHSDATLDSLDALDDPWRYDILSHWRVIAREGRLKRPFLLSAPVDLDGIEGPGHFFGGGPFLVLSDTGNAAAPDPAAVWQRLKHVSTQLTGTPTSSADPNLARADYDVGADVIASGVLFLNSLSMDQLPLTAAQVAAADSMLAWLEFWSDEVTWGGRDRLRADLGLSHMELRGLALRAGDRVAARVHAEHAARLSPRNASAFNALANSALLAGDEAQADSLMGIALRLGRPNFDLLLNAAVVQRMAGRPDSSLAVLRITQQMVDDTGEDDRGDVGSRLLLLLPATDADTAGAVRLVTVDAFSQLAALIQYQVALAEAMRGDARAADVAMTRARGLSVSEPVRCYALNMLQATRYAVQLSADAAAWFTAQEAQLRCGKR